MSVRKSASHGHKFQSVNNIVSIKLWAVVVMLIASAGLAELPRRSRTIPTPAVSSSTPAPASASVPVRGLKIKPYTAEIIGNDVYVRSGPGTNFYYCDKLKKGTKVQVIGTKSGWSRIIPPATCFSWISMRCVAIDIDNPTIGIITTNNVSVYAGSDYVLPIHSTSEQIKLNKGSKIKLLNEEVDDYYKISPPAGAYLWVSSMFLRKVADAKVTTGLPAAADPNKITKTAPKNNPATTAASDNTVQSKSEYLKKYYEIKKKVDAERKKPLDKQDYKEIKKALKAIISNKLAGNAARYAKFTLGRVEGFELALKAKKELEQQDKGLQKTTSSIDKTLSEKLNKVQDLGKFAVIGTLKNSSVYNGQTRSKYYRIVDEKGSTVCYAAPTTTAAKKDFSKFIDKKVGLIGKIKPHTPSAKAIVEFSEVELIKKP